LIAPLLTLNSPPVVELLAEVGFDWLFIDAEHSPFDTSQMQALMQAYPKLKGVIAPTTVGVAAASRVVSQARKCSSIRVTGLGLPNQMRTYVKSGCVKKVGLWNERDFGYLAEYVVHNLLAGKLTGKTGQSFVAGRLGKRTVQKGSVAGYGAGPVVVLSKPLVFTKRNIDKYHF